MNDYRVLTILPPQPKVSTNTELPFGVSFRFADRQQMFSWYLELVHINGHDKWTRDSPHTIPDGANYLPLQNYHASAALSARKKSDQFKNKFLAKSCHVASNLYKQLRKWIFSCRQSRRCLLHQSLISLISVSIPFYPFKINQRCFFLSLPFCTNIFLLLFLSISYRSILALLHMNVSF